MYWPDLAPLAPLAPLVAFGVVESLLGRVWRLSQMGWWPTQPSTVQKSPHSGMIGIVVMFGRMIELVPWSWSAVLAHCCPCREAPRPVLGPAHARQHR